MIKKLLSVILAATLCLGIMTSCGAKANDSITLFTWEGMFPQEVLDGFTKETGIKVNYANFDTDETMLAKLETSKGGDYDVVIADDYIIKTVVDEGLAQKLDKSKISNFANINPVAQGQFYDAKDEYTVPYGAGVQTIVYNPEKVKKEITGYADLWDKSLEDSIAVIGNYRVINGMALKIAGESYNTEDTATIEAAGKKLIDLAPNIRLIKDDNVQNDLISGEVSTAIMYTSQVTMAKLANPNLKVVFPKEGDGFGIMAGFVPSKAPNAEGAHKFFEYLLKPEVSAQCFEYIGYYCTNKAADEKINPEYKEFLTLPASFKNPEMIMPVSAAAEEVHTKVWTEFKNACQ
ncbi:MAG: spermidine/putrescine ABC transporter substrate-binding protein [Oscillospiraceae bacterium]